MFKHFLNKINLPQKLFKVKHIISVPPVATIGTGKIMNDCFQTGFLKCLSLVDQTASPAPTLTLFVESILLCGPDRNDIFL